MYSYPNLEPVCCSMSGSNCCFLTCIQISQVAGKVVWYSHLFQNFPSLLWSTQRFSIVNEAEVDAFLEFPRFFYDPGHIGNLISGSSAFSKPSFYVCMLSVHVLLKPGLKDFEYYLATMWNECNCVTVWSFFGITFLWDCNETIWSNNSTSGYLSKENKRIYTSPMFIAALCITAKIVSSPSVHWRMNEWVKKL